MFTIFFFLQRLKMLCVYFMNHSVDFENYFISNYRRGGAHILFSHFSSASFRREFGVFVAWNQPNVWKRVSSKKAATKSCLEETLILHNKRINLVVLRLNIHIETQTLSIDGSAVEHQHKWPQISFLKKWRKSLFLH